MKDLIKMFPVAKIIPVALISLLLTYLLKGYHFFTFQKSYFILIYGLLFCIFLYYVELSRHYSSIDFRLLLKKHANLVKLILILVFVAMIWAGVLAFHTVMARWKEFPSWILDYYDIASLTASYQTFGFIKRGLIPTLVSLVSSNYTMQLFCARIIGLIVFVGGAVAVSFSKQFSMSSRKLFLAVFLLAPVGVFYQAIFPKGQFDMTMIGILFFACSLNNRPASLIFDITGLLVHEGYLFLRLPFLLFNLISHVMDRGQKKNSYVFELLSLGVILVGFMMMCSNLVRRDRADLECNYFRLYPNLPLNELNHLQAFDPMAKDATIGFQMQIMNTYFHRKDFHTYLIPLFSCIAMVGLLTYFFSNLKGSQKLMDIFFSLGSFLSPLLLCIVALDFGRWMNFAFVSWLCYYILFRQKLFPNSSLSLNCLYGVLLSSMVFFPLGVYQQPLMYVLMK